MPAQVQISKILEIEGFTLLIEVKKAGQRNGYLFRRANKQQFFPKSYFALSEEERVRLLKEEIDFYCIWSADEQAFGFWTEGEDFIFSNK